MSMTRWKLTIEYMGTRYCGWQRQEDGIPSVQQAIEDAISRFCQQDCRLHVAGRTDAGVHASGQVAHFDLDYGDRDLDGHGLMRALNAHLRDEAVSIISAEKVDTEFHARFHATHKLYTYRILNRTAPPTYDLHQVWHVWGDLDIEAMRRGANYLLGHHDIDGVIFNAGALAVGKKISKAHIFLAWIIGGILPRIPVAPLPPNSMSSLAHEQAAYDSDPLIYHGQMAAGTGKELLMASVHIAPRLAKISTPFLALQGNKDTLVTGSEQLYQQASSQDKTLKSYDALHDLLHDKCAEQVISDIIEWLEVRTVVHH